MQTCLIYMTAGSMDEARRIGQALVSKRLAACVNIIDRMDSFYWWEGKVQSAKEVVMIAKTRESLVPRLTQEVRHLHSYECPCIVSLPITGGFEPFLDWIVKETG